MGTGFNFEKIQDEGTDRSLPKLACLSTDLLNID